MLIICGGKINIFPTSYQYITHKQPTYYPPLHSYFISPTFDTHMTHYLPTCPRSLFELSTANILLFGCFAPMLIMAKLFYRGENVGMLLSGVFVERMLISVLMLNDQHHSTSTQWAKCGEVVEWELCWEDVDFSCSCSITNISQFQHWKPGRWTSPGMMMTSSLGLQRAAPCAFVIIGGSLKKSPEHFLADKITLAYLDEWVKRDQQTWLHVRV